MARSKAGNAKAVDAPAARLTPIALELEAWRARAVPDPEAPLDAEDVARLVRDCFATLGVESTAAESFSVNTVHYYRRKDILDEPEGRTSAARYALRHVWQAAGARLAGFLGLVTLAEARDELRGADVNALVSFVAARVADARGREASRTSIAAAHAPAVSARPLRATTASYVAPIATATVASQIMATVVPLGDNALCLIPAAHAALRSPAAARSLVDALAAALGLDS